MENKIFSTRDYELYLEDAKELAWLEDANPDETELNEFAQGICFDDWNFYYAPILERYLDNHTCVITGSLGRWDGVIEGGDVVSSYKEVYDYLGSWWDIEIREDDNCLMLVGFHHDGRNYVSIRKLTDEGKAWFKEHCDDDYPIDMLFKNNAYSVKPDIEFVW